MLIGTNRTVWQLGFDLARYRWSLLNRLPTCRGPFLAGLHRWSPANSVIHECRQPQTMSHVIDVCPLTKFNGGLQSLQDVDNDMLNWPETMATTVLAKRMK